MTDKQITCQHHHFYANVDVNRIEDVGRFSADVKIHCEDCGLQFSFVGLPQGLDYEGATTNPDGTEGRFTIAPGPQPIQAKQTYRVAPKVALHD